MTLREKIEVMEAFERGEEIEINDFRGNWSTLILKEPEFGWNGDNYRIKPKPKQVIVIEKWLIKGYDEFFEITTSNINIYCERHTYDKVKLLDTYKVEL